MKVKVVWEVACVRVKAAWEGLREGEGSLGGGLAGLVGEITG